MILSFKYFKKILGLVLVTFIFGFLFWNIYKNWSVISNFPWKFTYQNLILLIIFLLPIYLLTALSWHLLILSLGARTSFLKSFKIWVFSNFGRFLPGVIWQYTGRIYLASKEGIPKTVTLTALILEAGLIITASSLIALFSILLVPLPGQFQLLKNPLIIVVLITLITLITFVILLGNAKLFNIITSFFQKITKTRIEINTIKVNKKYFFLLVPSFFLQFLFGGIVLFLLAGLATDLPFTSAPAFIGIYSVSWLFGYLTVVAPSGLGVQEASIAGLLTFFMPFPIAVVIAVAFRMSMLISEGLALLLNIAILKKQPEK